MRPLGTWERAAATDGRARDGFPQPSPSSPSSTIFLSPQLTPPSAHPLSFSPPYTPHISLALSLVNQVVHQIGKLEMDSLTQAHFAFSPLYSSHFLVTRSFFQDNGKIYRYCPLCTYFPDRPCSSGHLEDNIVQRPQEVEVDIGLGGNCLRSGCLLWTRQAFTVLSLSQKSFLRQKRKQRYYSILPNLWLWPRVGVFLSDPKGPEQFQMSADGCSQWPVASHQISLFVHFNIFD